MTDDERTTIAEAVKRACLEAAVAAARDGGYAGLCAEGRLELALDAIGALDLDAVVGRIGKAGDPTGA